MQLSVAELGTLGVHDRRVRRNGLCVHSGAVWDLAIDYPGSGTKANFYVSTRRLGIQVLEFDPTVAGDPEDRFAELDLIQTGDYAMGLALQVAENQKQLVVSDHGGGTRVFGE